MEEFFLFTAKSLNLHFPSQRHHLDSPAPSNGHFNTRITVNPSFLQYFFFVCFSVNLREFRFAQTMIFAISEINQNTLLLPNISVGYRIYDNCGSTLSSMRAAMALMNGEELTGGPRCSGQSAVHAIIGESESSSTIVLTRTIGPFKIPVVGLWMIIVFLSVSFVFNDNMLDIGRYKIQVLSPLRFHGPFFDIIVLLMHTIICPVYMLIAFAICFLFLLRSFYSHNFSAPFELNLYF